MTEGMIMDFMTIDAGKCARDGFCASECPTKILAIGDDGLPALVEGGEEYCINCYHCVAVCPTAAFTLGKVTPESCAPVAANPSEDQLANFMLSRRSARAFKQKAVDKDVLQNCIDIASHAPTGHNSQPVHWTVIYEAEEVKRLAGLVADWMRMMIDARPEMARQFNFNKVVERWDKGVDVILRGAPHIVIAHADRDLLSSPAACSIALTHFELAAHAKGLGCTWAGFFHAAAATFPPLSQALGLPAKHQIFGAMMVGFNKHKYHRVPPRVEARIAWK